MEDTFLQLHEQAWKNIYDKSLRLEKKGDILTVGIGDHPRRQLSMRVEIKGKVMPKHLEMLEKALKNSLIELGIKTIKKETK